MGLVGLDIKEKDDGILFIGVYSCKLLSEIENQSLETAVLII